MPDRLPVEIVLPDVLKALRTHRTCVLVAPTGAGKTTRLPGAALDAGFGPVVVLEPRRLAARSAARRTALERGVSLGDEVGYRVRFDRRAGSKTQLTFTTEGLFLRRLQRDPFLEGIGCVVLDEFHERSLELDLCLALVRRVQLDLREDLNLVVTSATLDAERVSAYLDGAPIVRSEGRSFPVTVDHLPPQGGERLEDHVVRAVQQLRRDDPGGDTLVFLGGRSEIRRAQASLSRALPAEIDVVELYGELSAEAQDAVLRPADRPRIVLATNVAESSVTVPGVQAVIDSGRVRRLRTDPRVGLSRLTHERVSFASAEQRAGRAGRLGPGRCLRLWSRAEERTLEAFDPPAITRVELSGVALQLYAWGETTLETFPWFEAPPQGALRDAQLLLRRLGAVDDGAGLSPLGKRMADIPAEPRLARLLLAGAEAGIATLAGRAAALLSERDPLRVNRGRHSSERVATGSESDVLDRLRALGRFAEAGPSAAPELAPAAARNTLRVASALERGLGDPGSRGRSPQPQESEERLLRALVHAFPDRLTRRRPDDPQRGVLVGGRGVRLAPECSVRESPLFLSLAVEDARGEALVRQASVVEAEWIDGGRTHTVAETAFDEARERVVGIRRTLLGELELERVETSADDPQAVAATLVATARTRLERALGLAREEIAGCRARVANLRVWCPELELPPFDDAFLEEVLAELAVGKRSFEELRSAPLFASYQARLLHQQVQALEREAPERLEVPSGSRLRLQYETGRPPVLAARIQELFGWTETPRIARGRVPVLLHLLAPNGRPQQVTDDLESFWSRTYFDVRKDLRQRYPKHDWPEDPLRAVARRRPGRPGRPRQSGRRR